MKMSKHTSKISSILLTFVFCFWQVVIIPLPPSPPPGSRPGSQPGTQPGSRPTGQPGSQPGSRPGQPSGQPGTQPGSRPGQPGGQPSRGSDSVVLPIQQPWPTNPEPEPIVECQITNTCGGIRGTIQN